MGIYGTERPLTIEDSEALKRLPYARAVVPFVQGNAEVEAGSLRRRTTIYGAGSQMPEAFSMKVQSGRFLPADDPTAPRAFAVLGSKLRNELFRDQNSDFHCGTGAYIKRIDFLDRVFDVTFNSLVGHKNDKDRFI